MPHQLFDLQHPYLQLQRQIQHNPSPEDFLQYDLKIHYLYDGKNEFKNEIEDHEKIVKILVYERERDENGNVLPSVFVEKFLEYEIEREDELFVQAYRNVSSPRRRYSNNFTNNLKSP